MGLYKMKLHSYAERHAPEGWDHICPVCKSRSTWPEGVCRVCKIAGQIRQGYIDSGYEPGENVLEFMAREAPPAERIREPGGHPRCKR